MLNKRSSWQLLEVVMVDINVRIYNNTLEIDVYDETGMEIVGETINTRDINITEHIKDFIDSLISDNIIKV